MNYVWVAVALSVARLLILRLFALAALALVLRGSRPADRPRLLNFFR